MPAANAVGNWNEQNSKPSASSNWRASLVPAAAVIPAPTVYTKAVAVKALVVHFLHPIISSVYFYFPTSV